MTRTSQNEFVAKALGIPAHRHRVSHDEQQASALDPCEVEGCGQLRIAHRNLDFFTDEAANAMLRRAMAKASALDIVRYGPEETEITYYIPPGKVDELKRHHGYNFQIAVDVDEKTAWAKAFIAWIEAGGKPNGQ